MISLKKLDKPEILVRKGDEWAGVIETKLANGEELTKTEKSRYSHKDIKAKLVKETNGKCAYCESKILHIDYADIEHISPKSIDPCGWVKWENLTLACSICNTNKSNYDTVASPFVDPYLQRPKDHMNIHGASVLPLPGSSNAVHTIHVLKLNRPDLLERRREKIFDLNKQALAMVAYLDAATQAILLQDLEEEMLADKEYSALAEDFIFSLKSKMGMI